MVKGYILADTVIDLLDVTDYKPKKRTWIKVTKHQ